MGKRTTAVRYARALVDVLSDDEQLTRVEKDLESLPRLFGEHADLRTALVSPAMAGRRKADLAEKVFEAAGMHPVSVRVLSLLAERGHLGLLDDLREEYQAACDERRKILPAEITTATEVPAERTDSYRKSIEKMTGQPVRLRTRVDPEIIGGVVTRIGSQVYDGSVRGQLERLHQKLRGE